MCILFPVDTVVTSLFPYHSLRNGLHEFYFADTHFEIHETRQLLSDSFGFSDVWFFFFSFDGHFCRTSFQCDSN